MELFNSRGEVNASSLQDAFATIAKYASILQENQPSNLGLSGRVGLSDAQQEDLISRAVYTNEGKMAMAQAMANPIN